ncbi:MAG TPA: hypothetical protein VEU76_09075 [Candidatus Udaeobacter sp.]|nr:hypothetical protein [Candidatus Udaeobacter sp.]
MFALLLCAGIGFFVSAPLTYLVSRRASGRLPLTHASKRRLDLPIWAAIFLLALSALIGAVIAILSAQRFDPANPAPAVIALLLLNLGALALVAGVVLLQVGLQIARLPFGPGAKVMRQIPGQPDRVVELIRVHPAFVAAVNERREAAPPQSTMTN